ncbi:MAG: SHOCT domain-containing protein [Clostridiales bacterium]|nr:SHOCT domain-containing protein [Clostridiales bacterium]
MNNVEELKKYKELLDSGVINQEEFESKKSELLTGSLNYDDRSEENENSSVVKPKNKKVPLIVGIAVGVIAIAVVLTLVFARSKKKDFNDMYGDFGGEKWCTIASDGSYMKIDTNPYDIEDHVEYSAWNKIKSVCKELGFPDSVIAKMESTNSLAGRQSESNDKYEVSWTYHPDNGMEVIFTIK